MTAERALRTKQVRGFYGIADTQASADPIEMVSQLLAGGCRLIQLRAKNWASDDIELASRDIARRCRQVGALFILNDHPMLVRSVAADGVHLGQSDMSTVRAREMVGPDRLIGRSTNDLDHIANTLKGADYLAFGPVWASTNAGDHKVVQGLEHLQSASRRCDPSVPLVAIGGITVGRIPLVRSAGATAWAAIQAVSTASDPIEATRLLCALKTHE